MQAPAIVVRGFVQEYQQNQSFRRCEYEWEGNDSGWKVWRLGATGDRELVIELGSGYVLIRPGLCGMCSTDTSRHLLPFDLPQVTGHEVVGEVYDKTTTHPRRVAVEINASHFATGYT